MGCRATAPWLAGRKGSPIAIDSLPSSGSATVGGATYQPRVAIGSADLESAGLQLYRYKYCGCAADDSAVGMVEDKRDVKVKP